MDNNFVRYYEEELRHLRELASEFARKFPKVAGRLGIGDHNNDDPHVERLFQGFAFHAGGLRQHLDAEFPAFTEALLDSVYPHYLKPTPSMVVVQFTPTPADSSLTDGFTIPRGTALNARCKLASSTVCEYRTAHAVQLWPIAIESIEYTSVLSSIADVRLPAVAPPRALLRIVLRLTGGRSFDELSFDSLPVHITGGDAISERLHETLIANAGVLVMRWGRQPGQHVAFGDSAQCTRHYGFDDADALLPGVPAAYRGHRLLHEYFAFPARFRGVELHGLRAGLQRCNTQSVELIVPLDRHDPALEGKLPVERLQLFATPAINLFHRRIVVAAPSGSRQELQLHPDRMQPLDIEVHSVTRVVDQSTTRHDQLDGDRRDNQVSDAQSVPYTLHRRPRVPGVEEQRKGARTDYAGTEVFLSLKDSEPAARQLVVDALCTNRDLPLLLAKDRNATFTLSSGAPIDGVRLLAGPSAPRFQPTDGETTWQLVNNLQHNYLTLNEQTGASGALRELLALYSRMGDPVLRREVEAVREIRCQSTIGPLPEPGPRRYVRGLEIELHCEEHVFAHGALTLGTVLAHFFAKHASSHSFTQTVLHTRERGEVYRWPAIMGQTHCL